MEQVRIQFTFEEDGLSDAVYFDLNEWNGMTKKKQDELKTQIKAERIAKHKKFIEEESQKVTEEE